MASLGVVIRIPGPVIECIHRPYEELHIIVRDEVIVGVVDVVMGTFVFQRLDMLRQVGNACGGIHHGVTVPVLIQMVHPHFLIFVPVFIVEPEFLVILRIMDVAEIASRKLKDWLSLAVLERIDGKIPVVVLVSIDDIAFLVEPIKGIFLIISLGTEHLINLFPVLCPVRHVLVIRRDMQVIEAVKKDRGIFPLDGLGDPDSAALIVDRILVVVVVIYLRTGSVDRNLSLILFLEDVLDPVPGMALVDIDHLDVVGAGFPDYGNPGPFVIHVIARRRIIEDLDCIIQGHGGTCDVAVYVISGLQGLGDIRIALEDPELVVLDVDLLVHILLLPLGQILQCAF